MVAGKVVSNCCCWRQRDGGQSRGKGLVTESIFESCHDMNRGTNMVEGIKYARRGVTVA